MHSTHSRAAFAWLVTALLAAPAARAADVTVTLESGSDFTIEREGDVPLVSVDGDTANLLRGGALFVHTTGTNSLFVGPLAGSPASVGSHNSGFGHSALLNNSSGYGNSAFGSQALRSNSTGHRNSAFGDSALVVNSSGSMNTAAGWHALISNSTGSENSAFGTGALRYGGNGNSAFGKFALYNNTGQLNAAFGAQALFANTTGSDNVAVGLGALGQNTTGSRNVAVGHLAGLQSNGSDNVYLAHQGVAGESGQIRIGTTGTHTRARIAGIHGQTTTAGIAVLVAADGTLGTTTSSARFKQDVRDMGAASDRVMKLRPVTFRYREDAVGAEGAKTPQYSLIAEEVAEVAAPELVAPDADGRPYSVKYHELPALLLNEVQEQRRTIARLEARIAEIERRQPRQQASR